MDQRALLEHLYHVGVNAAAGGPLAYTWTRARASGASPWIIALGKAAPAMLTGALTALDEAGVVAQGTLCISHERGAPDARFAVAIGDHPVPGTQSFHCAALLGQFVRRIPVQSDVIVLLSGGTSSLIAAPITGVSPSELQLLFKALLSSGESIEVVNAIRRRFLQWAGGRLAEALIGCRISVVVLSDVLSGEIAAIGSGPCAPDDVRAAALLDVPALPAFARSILEAVHDGIRPETPKAGSLAFAQVEHTIVGDNFTARSAIIAEGRLHRLNVVEYPRLIVDEAGQEGSAFAHFVGQNEPALVVAGGEPVVTLAPDHGIGGRCQAFALAAASALNGLSLNRAQILAAGTDGRDGPTDAAGAVVDGATWHQAEALGLNPQRAMEQHDGYPLLDALGALIRTGPTGTNVNDIFLGLRA